MTQKQTVKDIKYSDINIITIISRAKFKKKLSYMEYSEQ